MKKQKKCYFYTRVQLFPGFQTKVFRKNIKGRPEFARMMEKIKSCEDDASFVLVCKLNLCGGRNLLVAD